LIVAARLAFARGPEPIFGPLDFDVVPAQVLVVEGGNGSGKTTLLRVLAGLLDATGGTLAWRGEVREPWRPAPRDIALLAHQLGMKPDLSPAENLAFAIGLSGGRAAMPLPAALAAVGLEGYEELPTRRLSAGQRKRAALAMLLVAPASIWLLDEPYANLDRDGHELVDRLVGMQIRRGGAVVMTSHGHFAPLALPFERITMGGAA
jgi:heme exporter protein A